MKHLELFNNGFDDTITEKLKPENWPYIGYDALNDAVAWSTIVEKEETIEIPGYVDLGLSVMWAECNLGASKPEEFGLYYGWGDVEGYSEGEPLFTNNYFNNDISYSKTYDAVTVSKKDDIYMDLVHYRMPTAEQWQELDDNTTREIVILNGCRVVKFTSKINNAVIYMPVYESGSCNYRTSTPASNKYYGTIAEVWYTGQTIDVYNGNISAQYCYIRGVCSPVPKVQIIPYTSALSSDSTYGIFYNLENIEITSSNPFIMHIGKTEDFTFADDDPNRLDKYESSKATSGYSIKLSKEDLNLGAGIHDYMYVKFECTQATTLASKIWIPASGAEKSILLQNGLKYNVPKGSKTTLYRMCYQDWKGYDINVNWTGSRVLPTYYASICDFSYSSDANGVLNYYRFAKGNTVVNSSVVDSWESHLDEDGFVYVRFDNNSTAGRVTFTSSKPAEN